MCFSFFFTSKKCWKKFNTFQIVYPYKNYMASVDGCSMVNLNIEPNPSSDSTEISPPHLVTKSLHNTNPRPILLSELLLDLDKFNLFWTSNIFSESSIDITLLESFTETSKQSLIIDE